jgi:hypothetical protein
VVGALVLLFVVGKLRSGSSSSGSST